jgi:hypothetical protein
LIVTLVPTGPDKGENDVMVGTWASAGTEMLKRTAARFRFMLLRIGWQR